LHKKTARLLGKGIPHAGRFVATSKDISQHYNFLWSISLATTAGQGKGRQVVRSAPVSVPVQLKRNQSFRMCVISIRRRPSQFLAVILIFVRTPLSCGPPVFDGGTLVISVIDGEGLGEHRFIRNDLSLAGGHFDSDGPVVLSGGAFPFAFDCDRITVSACTDWTRERLHIAML
jgi:hypothetical protein